MAIDPALLKEINELVVPGLRQAAQQAAEQSTETDRKSVTLTFSPEMAAAFHEYVVTLQTQHRRAVELAQEAVEALKKERRNYETVVEALIHDDNQMGLFEEETK